MYQVSVCFERTGETLYCNQYDDERKAISVYSEQQEIAGRQGFVVELKRIKES
jgi:hypothetical protein